MQLLNYWGEKIVKLTNCFAGTEVILFISRRLYRYSYQPQNSPCMRNMFSSEQFTRIKKVIKQGKLWEITGNMHQRDD